MKTIVLYSGGLDSTVVLAQEIRDQKGDVLALSFDYGQSCGTELTKCSELSKYWGFRHKVVPMTLPFTDARSEIPARNTLFLAKALEIALIEKAGRVVYGAEPDARYADSSEEYILAMTAVFAAHGIEFAAPVKHFRDKKHILITALDLGVPLDLVHSSRTGAVLGGCKTSFKYLSALREVFPNVSPVTLLGLLAGPWECNDNPYQLSETPTGSFKYWPALLFLAGNSCVPAGIAGDGLVTQAYVSVYTTGNWGKSLEYMADILGFSELTIEKHIVHKTDPNGYDDLAKNVWNTNHPLAQWGMKQALSRLPRPEYMGNPALFFRKTQGHLQQAVESLGYTRSQDGFRLTT